MSPALDLSRVEIKFGRYGTAPAAALADTTLLGRAQNYRRIAGSRMMALDRAGIAKIPPATFLTSRKIDGEFCLLVYENGEALTVNPGGTVRVGLPVLEDAAAALAKAGVKRLIAAAELYVKRPDGKRPRVHDVSRVARRPESDADVNSLSLAIFDLLEIDGKDAPTSYSEICNNIGKLFPGGRVHCVEVKETKSEKDLVALFEQWVEKDGEEGLVARSESAGIFKIKPRHTLDAAVIGFAEGTDDRKGLLHDLLLAVMRPDGSFQILCRVGGGFTEEMRREFLSDLTDLAAESDYTEVNSDRVAYRMVRPEWVIEISCLDVISQTTRGGTIDRMVLTWDGTKWHGQRRMPLVSVISPQFVRRREDKHANPQDIRIAQLTDLVEVPNTDRSAADMVLPPSEVIRRKVATKVLKGAQLVRKLVLWKTNKDAVSADFPAYVLAQTDYSPNRKTPLERDIRVSNDRHQIEKLFAAWDAECFVKGWNVVE